MGSMTLPAKQETLKRYQKIYHEKLLGMNTMDLALKYDISRRIVQNIVKTMAQACDLDLDSEDEIRIAREKAEMRNEELREIIRLAKEPKEIWKKKISIAVKALTEMRSNEELIYKLKGLLKIKFEQNIDKRKIIIMHNMGGGKETAGKIEGKTEEIVEMNSRIEDE